MVDWTLYYEGFYLYEESLQLQVQQDVTCLRAIRCYRTKFLIVSFFQIPKNFRPHKQFKFLPIMISEIFLVLKHIDSFKPTLKNLSTKFKRRLC